MNLPLTPLNQSPISPFKPGKPGRPEKTKSLQVKVIFKVRIYRHDQVDH
jgi:hypothetical protein